MLQAGARPGGRRANMKMPNGDACTWNWMWLTSRTYRTVFQEAIQTTAFQDSASGVRREKNLLVVSHLPLVKSVKSAPWGVNSLILPVRHAWATWQSSWAGDPCSHAGTELRMGPSSWGLVLCSHCLEILNNFISEFVFCKWSMHWGLGTFVSKWSLFLASLGWMGPQHPASPPCCYPLPRGDLDSCIG